MMKFRQPCVTRGLLACWLLLISFVFGSVARADTCARAKIEIDQSLAFERQAFEARLLVANGLPTTAMTDFSVTVVFMDQNHQPVLPTPGATGTAPLFAYNAEGTGGVPSTIDGGASQTLKWLIIPAPGAAAGSSTGVPYWIGATVNYKLNGVQQTLSLDPSAITVKPMADLVLEYFLPSQVLGDDPHTLNVVEPPVPFYLGVRVVNIGGGAANALQIDSGQPQIVENDQDLLIHFQINSCDIDGTPETPTLLANFGNVLPQSVGMGRWTMTASLTGKFTALSTTVSHSDDLGGKVTSLIQNTSTYDLIGVVQVDLPGRDALYDFLGRLRTDGAPLTIHESDQVEPVDSNGHLISTVVQEYSNQTVEAGDGSKLQVTVTPTVPGFGYVKKTDVWSGAKVIKSVTRSDGKTILPQNAWLSKEQDITSPYSWHWYINVFDSFGTADSGLTASGLSYTVQYADAHIDHAPVIEPLGDLYLTVGGSNRYDGVPGYKYAISASDPDAGDSVTMTAGGLPTGALFTAPATSSTNSVVATLEWNPTANQVGDFFIPLKATDGIATDSETLKLHVVTGSAIDAWKKKYFGDQTDPAIVGNLADPDGDGLSNLVEYALGLDPTKPDQEPTEMAVEQVSDGTTTQRYLTLTYVRRLDDPTLVFTVLAADSLDPSATWTPQTTVMDVTQDGVPVGFQRVKVRDSQAIQDTSVRRYMKLQVSTTN